MDYLSLDNTIQILTLYLLLIIIIAKSIILIVITI
jgi:hypothetical protein